MTPSELIDKQIEELGDWRGSLLAQLRRVIHEADPEIAEEWKWGTGVWSHSGMVCALAACKDHVKVNFFRGAALEDPQGLFNSGLEAKKTRAIDIFQGEELNREALNQLVHAAVRLNAGQD